MKKADKDRILKEVAFMSDEKLKEVTYDAIYDSLGSESEEMYERGYDAVDIAEREKYEKYMSERSGILIQCCEARGIDE